MTAGVYRTRTGFFPGLTITIPDGWYLAEQDAGELKLHPNDHPDDQLVLWKDVRIVVSNHRSARAGTIVTTVPQTPDAFAKWFTTDPDFTVLEPAATTTIAGMTGQAFAVAISKTANYGDPGCPANPRCADFFADPIHGGGEFYGTGGETADWLFFGTASYPTGRHLVAIVLESVTPTDLQAFEREARPLLDSLVLPATYITN